MDGTIVGLDSVEVGGSDEFARQLVVYLGGALNGSEITKDTQIHGIAYVASENVIKVVMLRFYGRLGRGKSEHTP